MSSIVAAATRAAVSVTVCVLVAVGVGTGALLHLEAVAARDETLLAALAAGPGAASVDGAEVPYRVVDARQVVGLPPETIRRAQEEEVVARLDLGAMRVVLGALDTEGHEARHHPHRVLAAVAPRVTLRQSVGPFVVAWLVMTTLGSVMAAALQRRWVGRAVAPLGRAVEEATAAARLGPSARLSEAGPDEVRALLVALNGLLARVETAFSSQTRFTAEAAHELRTPITTLVGEVEVALRRPRSADELRAALVRTGAAARRLAELVEGLLTLARVDTGLAEDVREDRVLEDLVRAATLQEAAELHSAGVVVETSLTGQHLVRVHPPLIVASIATLLRNVARHAPGAPAPVGVVGEDGFVTVRVDDAGPGLDPQDAHDAFERFSRGAAARRLAPEGLGLGLPLARAVARAHGGDCTLGTSPFGGCRVELRLPVGQAR